MIVSISFAQPLPAFTCTYMYLHYCHIWLANRHNYTKHYYMYLQKMYNTQSRTIVVQNQ